MNGGADIWRCSVCGSVFYGHACGGSPGWIAMMVVRTRMRRDERDA